jgi:hypothetical protein
VATLACAEVVSAEEVLVIVDAAPGAVRLCVSRRNGADADATLSLADARHALAALQAAVDQAAGLPDHGGAGSGESHR